MKSEGIDIGEAAGISVVRGNPFPVEDGFIIKQKVEVELFDGNGKRKWREEIHNVVTTLGKQYVADALLRGSAAKPAMAGMELGTDNTTASAGDTDVITAVTTTGGYQAFDSGYPQQSTASTVFKVTWAAGEATQNSIQESAIKSSDGAADAISRITFTSVNKGASDTLAVTVTWTFS
jgi:hypothetical protein